MPVTVASAERSFNSLVREKNVLRTTMGQKRLPGLGVPVVESEGARSLDFSEIVAFLQKKACKIPFSRR